MKLTEANVKKVLIDCLFKERESCKDCVVAKGVFLFVGFHPERLSKNSQNIEEMLQQLPSEFHTAQGGGYQQACIDHNGEQWGEHPTIDALLCLGIAIKKIQLAVPLEITRILPGVLPTFSVIR